MQVDAIFEPNTESKARLRLFSLYVDVAAAMRARWAAEKVASLISLRCKPYSELWALDFFQTDQPLRSMMLQGAAEADVLIIALSSLDRRNPKLVEWLDVLANRKAGVQAPGLLIGLLGGEDCEPRELGCTVKHLMYCAQRMGRDFIWQWMGQEAMNDATWLTDNVSKFLSRKQSLSNMAWLQEMDTGIGQPPEMVWLYG